MFLLSVLSFLARKMREKDTTSVRDNLKSLGFFYRPVPKLRDVSGLQSYSYHTLLKIKSEQRFFLQKIQLGMLMDYAMEFTNVGTCNGVLTDTTYIDANILGDIYKTLFIS